MIYADNAATTKLSGTALNAMLPSLREAYGNPSSLYSLGQQAAEALAEARQTVADCLHCRPEEIYFTSGGSEADNRPFSPPPAGERRGERPTSFPLPLSTTPSSTPSRSWRRRASPSPCWMSMRPAASPPSRWPRPSRTTHVL